MKIKKLTCSSTISCDSPHKFWNIFGILFVNFAKFNFVSTEGSGFKCLPMRTLFRIQIRHIMLRIQKHEFKYFIKFNGVVHSVKSSKLRLLLLWTALNSTRSNKKTALVQNIKCEKLFKKEKQKTVYGRQLVRVLYSFSLNNTSMISVLKKWPNILFLS